MTGMKNVKVVGFDMQGTLTDNRCSDEFWMETLPRLNARYKGITLSCSKKYLRAYFKRIGRYDYRYYDHRYWLKKLRVPKKLSEILDKQKHKPRVYPNAEAMLRQYHHKKILITSTTKEFIELELGPLTKYFGKIYSTIDDMGIAGKPSNAYRKICRELRIRPEELLYIGDNKEMDKDNPEKIGIKTRLIRR